MLRVLPGRVNDVARAVGGRYAPRVMQDREDVLGREGDGRPGGDSPEFGEPEIYAELRRLAERLLQDRARHHTLQPTALVHEAYLKLQYGCGEPLDRSRFFAAAATAMRHILVDYARRRRALKRGGEGQRVTLDSNLEFATEATVDVLQLNELLERLARLDERAAQIVELRVFGGLTIDETAAALDVSHGTVSNDWRIVRAWLAKELDIAR